MLSRQKVVNETDAISGFNALNVSLVLYPFL